MSRPLGTSRGPRLSRRAGRLAAAAAVLLLLLLLGSGPAAAQGFEDADEDSTATEEAGGLLGAVQAAEQAQEEEQPADVDLAGPFLQGVTNEPKGGVKADVRLFSYYVEDNLSLKLREGTFSNLASWSWEDYRQQDRTVEKRHDNFNYGGGTLLPFVAVLTGNWDWSEDYTTNSLGYMNLSKRDLKNTTLNVSKAKVSTGPLVNSARGTFMLDDQQALNVGQRNDVTEASLSGGLQTGVTLGPGLTLAGRAYGQTTSGDRTLGTASSSSSATADSLAFGVYFDRSFGVGRVAVARSNLDKRYLDFKKNSSGQIDTTGLPEADKVVEEMESKNAVALEFEHKLKIRRMSLDTKFTRDMDDLDYRVSLVGLKERQQDILDVKWGWGVGADSLAVSYRFLWKWDDQRIKAATLNRGRQYAKGRDCDLAWIRPLIGQTRMTFRYHEGLSQDIAQHVHNQNDKDRLTTDVSLRLDRDWPGRFKTAMVLSYKQAKDISIRESRSSNNNVKDSYEISPSYVWDVARWLEWDQSYQIFIQYTDYIYSYLEAINRDDNYNKRGNLSTKVTFWPTGRLTVVVRHDYNRRFNATRVVTDAAGNSYYHKDQTQTISKIDLGVNFKVASGVTIEGATYQNEDTKNTLGSRPKTTITRSGEVWVGAKVNKKWGPATRPLELSAMVKKYNAFGPSVTAASADYWEADVWLKWKF